MKEFEGSSNGSALRVGDLTVVPSLNLLVRGGERIRVEPRLMDVLMYLIERAGEVISKQELMERVWNDRHVTDDVLTVSIYNLRKALGDEARQPRYIQTVSRRGYLLIAPVQAASPEGGVALVETDAESVAIGAARAAPAGYSLRAKMAAPAIVALAVAMALVFAATRPPRHVVRAEAQKAYLKGRYLLDQRSIQGWQRALAQFEEAISLDPNYPAAQAGLRGGYLFCDGRFRRGFFSGDASPRDPCSTSCVGPGPALGGRICGAWPHPVSLRLGFFIGGTQFAACDRSRSGVHARFSVHGLVPGGPREGTTRRLHEASPGTRSGKYRALHRARVGAWARRAVPRGVAGN